MYRGKEALWVTSGSFSCLRFAEISVHLLTVFELMEQSRKLIPVVLSTSTELLHEPYQVWTLSAQSNMIISTCFLF